MNPKFTFARSAVRTLPLLISLAVVAVGAQSQSYSIQELKPLQDGSYSSAYGISTTGYITGTADGLDLKGRGAFWSAAGGLPVASLGWGDSKYTITRFYGINSSKETAGSVRDIDGMRYPLFWSPVGAGLTRLPIGAFKEGEAYSVNDWLSLGDNYAIAGAVFASTLEEGIGRAVLWNKQRKLLVLPTLYGGIGKPGNYARSIGNSGFVGGSSANAWGLHEQAVVWSSLTGSMVAWLNGPEVKQNRGFGGGVFSVKDNRYWCGYVYPDEQGFAPRACFWPNLTECHLIESPEVPYSVARAVRDSNSTKNHRPEVVGDFQIFSDGNYYHAFVYDPVHGTRDLNNLIPAGSGWTLEYAYDIDNKGRIIGSGTYQGQPRGFILNPVLMIKFGTSLSLLKSLQTAYGQVEMLDAVPSDTRIEIRASNNAVSVPSYVALKQGQQRISFPITAATVRQRTEVTITLTLGEQEISTRITVIP